MMYAERLKLTGPHFTYWMCVGRDSQQMFGQSPARLSKTPLTESVTLHGKSSKLLRQPGNA